MKTILILHNNLIFLYVHEKKKKKKKKKKINNQFLNEFLQSLFLFQVNINSEIQTYQTEQTTRRFDKPV